MPKVGCGECLIEFENMEAANEHMKKYHPDAVAFAYSEGRVTDSDVIKIRNLLFDDKEKRKYR